MTAVALWWGMLPSFAAVQAVCARQGGPGAVYAEGRSRGRVGVRSEGAQVGGSVAAAQHAAQEALVLRCAY